MCNSCYYFERYLLDKHYAVCEDYLYRRIDWNVKSKEIKEHGVIFFSISDVISLFPHLELDENYELICYLSSEYHGIWGHVAAIEIGASLNPVDVKRDWFTMGTRFELPESAVSPMEAIYNDGTPEGYFESVLCKLFLDAIPYSNFEQERWDLIMFNPPGDLTESWDTRIDIPDWRPRTFTKSNPNAILAFRREMENGFGSSSGCDRIYLTQYSFKKGLRLYHALNDKSDSIYHGQIDNDKRYTDKRHCCVFSESSLLVAEEKQYTHSWN